MGDLRQCVYSMLEQNNHLNSEIVKHFLHEGFKRRTTYDIVKRYEIGLPAEELSSARPTSFNGQNFKLLKNAAANRIGVSQ